MPTATKVWDFGVSDQGFAPVGVASGHTPNVAYGSGAWTWRSIPLWNVSYTITVELWLNRVMWAGDWLECGASFDGATLADSRVDPSGTWLTRSATYSTTVSVQQLQDPFPCPRIASWSQNSGWGVPFTTSNVRVRSIRWQVSYTAADGSGTASFDHTYDFTGGALGFTSSGSYDAADGYWVIGDGYPGEPGYLQGPIVWGAPIYDSATLELAGAFTLRGLGLPDGAIISEIRWTAHRGWQWTGPSSLPLALWWTAGSMGQWIVDNETLSGYSGAVADHVQTTDPANGNTRGALDAEFPIDLNSPPWQPALILPTSSWSVSLTKLTLEIDYTSTTPPLGPVETDSERQWLHVGVGNTIETHDVGVGAPLFVSPAYTDISYWTGLAYDSRAGNLAAVGTDGAGTYRLYLAPDPGALGTEVFYVTAISMAIARDSKRQMLTVFWENGGDIQYQQSIDGGATWSAAASIVGGGTTLQGTLQGACYEERTDSHFLSVLAPGGGIVYKSADFAADWTAALT